MELGANTYSLRAVDRVEAFRRLGEFGLDAIELWTGHAAYTGGPRARDVVRDATAHGLRLRAYCIGGLFGLPRATVTARMARALDYAAELGVDLVTAIVDPDAAPGVDGLVRRTGMRIALENHWYTELARPADVRRALAACSPAVGAAIDVGHFAFLGYDLAAVARELGPRTLHVHVKAVRRASWLERWQRRRRRQFRMDGSEPGPGDGLDRFVAALRASGYRGMLAIEDESNGGDGRMLPRWQERARALLASWVATPATPTTAATTEHAHA
jgi:sugar phosphate isomerase/epimerase